MAEYIDCDAFLSSVNKRYCEDCLRRKGVKNGKYQVLYEIGGAACRACWVADMIDEVYDFPTADVVERKHGEWIKERHPSMKYFQYKCSECKKFSGLNDEEWIWKPNYCPNCGADMRAEEGET